MESYTWKRLYRVIKPINFRKDLLSAAAIALTLPAASASMTEGVIVETPAYRWEADTIFQGPFKAYAPNSEEIISDYSAQPGYFMPVDKTWKRRNDLSAYPRLSSSNTLHNAIYTMGLDEMVNAVEPDSTLRTGKEWPGVWTRDVSYSIILAMAALQPEVSRISLEHKISPAGRIIQDTGSGGAWPVSSDRQIWGIAAFEVYKSTGDKKWLEKIYPVIKNSLEDDYQTIYDPSTGLVRGETSFIDWREQSYPKWMQTADIYQSEALGTSVVHAQAWRTLAEMARILGREAEAATFDSRADRLAEAINRELWMDDKGYYAMYLYGRDFPIMNPRAETLGEALAILYGVATPERARVIAANNPTTPFGPGIFFPQIADMPPYHNNSLWPWVAAYWTLANAKAGNAEGVMQGIGSIFRPAALFATNKENFVLDNGDIATELNSSNMLWCLSGNIAITLKMLFGVNYEADGLRFAPFIPKAMADTRSLSGLRYRDAVLNITVEGYGDRIRRFLLNGKEHAPFIPSDISGVNDIRIVMADNEIAPSRVNETPNVKAPLTPIAWLANDPALDGEGVPVNNLLRWNPIEYIGHYDIYRDGKKIASTRETSYDALIPGEYMVVGVSGDGVESFASEPRSNRPAIVEQMPSEWTAIKSAEACNLPDAPVLGFRGSGFAEVDQSTRELKIPVNIKQGGTYALTFRYANGNGPVNTENKCAIRSVYVDGKRLGTIVMPQRGVGNWNDWGTTNVLETTIPAGRHEISVRYTPLDANMNGATNHALIDQLTLTRLRP
ncbi:MAG: hypothetical protein NC210_03145 [[Clostridium] fimetarium]|nr:hypothetical protein [Alistipes timonensis]MCM1405398.1 hypothetical protein [[Clostridium] fimetarium]